VVRYEDPTNEMLRNQLQRLWRVKTIFIQLYSNHNERTIKSIATILYVQNYMLVGGWSLARTRAGKNLGFLEKVFRFLGFNVRRPDTKLRPRNSRRISHTWYTLPPATAT